jgi:predicted O-methyltransferase YrrM
MIQLRDKKWFGRPIPGWLWRADALKLYEIAYFAERDILEFGPYHGLSTHILAMAVRDRPTSRRVYSVDLNAEYLAIDRDHLKRGRLLQYVETVCARAATAMRRFADESHQFDFIFIDHSHARRDVDDVCGSLDAILAPGGWAFFHDYNDARNREGNPAYGVYQAVNEFLNTNGSYTLHGVYGCGALVRRA